MRVPVAAGQYSRPPLPYGSAAGSWASAGQLPEVYARDDRPDAAFEEASAAGAEADYPRLAEEQDLCRQAVAGMPLEQQFTHSEVGPDVAALRV